MIPSNAGIVMSHLQSLLSAVPDAAAPADIVDAALETVRRHLGMEVAYLSEFVGEDSVFRAVSAPGLEALLKPGDSRPLSEVYCLHIIDGRLPGVIPDTRAEPLAMSLPITAGVPIGSHFSVPIRREDGSVYGMFCCLSPRPNPSLGPRDLQVMELFAALSAEQVNTGLRARARRDGILAATASALGSGGFDLLFQPIVDLGSLRPTGFEALSRFRSMPYRGPDLWFAEAADVGMGPTLECAAADRALDALDLLPAGLHLSVNANPATVEEGTLGRILRRRDLSRIVLEITEQAIAGDFDRLAWQLDALREEGLRLAVDDAGAGYAGLQQILRLRPDIIKLDKSLTRGIDADQARASLAEAMTGFARRTGALVVAEGIETAEELAVLRSLGIDRGQGYLLGRPMPLREALARPALRLDLARTG